MGGRDFFSNGIHLNVIEAADDPAAESWRNLRAIDDLVREIIETDSHLVLSALAGDAAAGGVPFALAADHVVAREDVVLNPYYQHMGGLYGSEYWTYLLPRRVGAELTARLTGAAVRRRSARRAGRRDRAARRRLRRPPRTASAPSVRAHRRAPGAQPRHGTARRASGAGARATSALKPLAAYRSEELARSHDASSARTAATTRRAAGSSTSSAHRARSHRRRRCCPRPAGRHRRPPGATKPPPAAPTGWRCRGRVGRCAMRRHDCAQSRAGGDLPPHASQDRHPAVLARRRPPRLDRGVVRRRPRGGDGAARERRARGAAARPPRNRRQLRGPGRRRPSPTPARRRSTATWAQPGTAVTGFPPGTVNGTHHAADAVAQQAKTDLTTAYNDAAGRRRPAPSPRTSAA